VEDSDWQLHDWKGQPLPITCGVGVPVVVDGRLWGVIAVASSTKAPLPGDTEARLAAFTELIATAIGNAEAHDELSASRARVVASADEARRKIERDLHDGAQQRFVSLALQLRQVQASVPPSQAKIAAELDQVAAGLSDALIELHEFARGIHPPVLAEAGLGPALRALTRRSAVPIKLDVRIEKRLPERVEVTAYFIVSEALTNAAKHAHATVVHVTVDATDSAVRLAVRDDGVGGADPARGSGLLGLYDRVEAAGGTVHIHSPAGEGTELLVELPLRPSAGVAAD
jgi:signal transduction histidine kinase